MKTKFSFSILIGMFFILLPSCENSELQKSNTAIQERSDCVDECEDCPVEDCCCSITITAGGATHLELCGTSDPCLSTMACGPIEAGNCEISGYIIDMDLDSEGTATGLFCVAKNTALTIQSSNSVTARITCRVGQSPPSGVQVTFNTPPITNKVYYTANGDCELVNCL